MDLTGYGWTIFWVVAFGVAGAAIVWTRTQRRRVSQAPRMYTEALRALVDGEDQLAFERLKAVVSEDSSNLDAYLKLGDLLRRRGRLDRAIQVHEDLTVRLGLTRSGTIAIHRSLAQDHLAAEHYEAAERSLRRILELDRENRWASSQLVYLLELTGRFEEAFETHRDMLKRTAQSDGHQLAIYRVLQGQQIDANGKGHDARLLYKDALNHDNRCLAAMLSIGDSYWREGRQEDAVTWWGRFTDAEPKAAHLVFERLRKAFFEMGHFGEIARVYEQTLDTDPANTPALLGLAELALKKGEHDHALAHFRRVLDIDPDNVGARAGIVRVLVEQQKLPTAAEEIEDLLNTRSFRSDGLVCQKCHHKVNEPTWYCPNCRAVDSFRLY
ncbi:MAG: tetratricopeptide repeat protein [candidate division Zixibacteria bacterium]|nr:tetratricopeptide repeat protein [candidate division Zixibacteria bacterium]